MRRRPVDVLSLPEYPRPVMPAGLNEDQQDALLERMMSQLMTEPPRLRAAALMGLEVRATSAGDGSLHDDVIEF